MNILEEEFWKRFTDGKMTYGFLLIVSTLSTNLFFQVELLLFFQYLHNKMTTIFSKTMVNGKFLHNCRYTHHTKIFVKLAFHGSSVASLAKTIANWRFTVKLFHKTCLNLSTQIHKNWKGDASLLVTYKGIDIGAGDAKAILNFSFHIKNFLLHQKFTWYSAIFRFTAPLRLKNYN